MSMGHKYGIQYPMAYIAIACIPVGLMDNFPLVDCTFQAFWKLQGMNLETCKKAS